jgi:hypothetical protein
LGGNAGKPLKISLRILVVRFGTPDALTCGTGENIMGNKKNPNRIWTVVICGVAASAMSLPAFARDNGAPVDIHTTITGVHEVADGPLAGLHAEAKVKGKVVDIYLAPMNFVKKYDVAVKPGQEVHIVGVETAEAAGDVVLTREITTGTLDKRTGIFHENMTIYLRNDEGPLW